MQPRKRYYCIGIKRKDKFTPDPYIRVKPLFETGENIEFDYLPPTNYDVKTVEKHKADFKNQTKKFYTYSGQKKECFAWTTRVPLLIKQHPVLEISPTKYAQFNTYCAILTPETHELLQGFQSGYTSGFSFTRRIAMVGNSWHVSTIAEIFKLIFINENKERKEKE
ncbi:MAG: hypothetical protein FWF51_06485 [Chitinivibrionia bacterium]|nr:hypothetical protein [Chitinivibrionia bacterium]